MVSRPPRLDEILSRQVGEYGKGTIDQRVNLARLQGDRATLITIVKRLSRACQRTFERSAEIEGDARCAVAEVASGIEKWTDALTINLALANALNAKVLDAARECAKSASHASTMTRRAQVISGALYHARKALAEVTHAQS